MAERKLTEREKARTAYVEDLSARLREEGWRSRDLTVSIEKANRLGCLSMLPVCAAFAAWFILRNGFDMLREISTVELILVVLLSVALIFVHEGLHGVTWAAFAPEHFRQIEFGFIKEQLTPYCWSGAPLTRGKYLAGSLMPMLVLGVIPCALSCVLCWPAWLWLGEIMLLGACGDWLISLKLLGCRRGGRELCCLDHPTECGLIVFER